MGCLSCAHRVLRTPCVQVRRRTRQIGMRREDPPRVVMFGRRHLTIASTLRSAARTERRGCAMQYRARHRTVPPRSCQVRDRQVQPYSELPRTALVLPEPLRPLRIASETALTSMTEASVRNFTINFGPQHPAAHAAASCTTRCAAPDIAAIIGSLDIAFGKRNLS